MSPPYVSNPEWFMKNVVDRRLMKKLDGRIYPLYVSLLGDIVYRAHHISFKSATVFPDDFNNIVARACGFKRNYYKYLPNYSAIKYMLNKLRLFRKKTRKKRLWGDIRWAFEPLLSQAYFWYVTIKSFYTTWYDIVYKGYKIPQVVNWRDAITLYVISDFIATYLKCKEKCVRKKWIGKYEEYFKVGKEKKSQ